MSYVPHTEREREDMLAVVGASSLDELFAHLPSQTRCGPLDVPEGLGEMDLASLMGTLASKNRGASDL